jgi:hypothetical protein
LIKCTTADNQSCTALQMAVPQTESHDIIENTLLDTQESNEVNQLFIIQCYLNFSLISKLKLFGIMITASKHDNYTVQYSPI